MNPILRVAMDYVKRQVNTGFIWPDASVKYVSALTKCFI
jgi:hypothetical protein